MKSLRRVSFAILAAVVVVLALVSASLASTGFGFKAGVASSRVSALGWWDSSDWFSGVSAGPYIALPIGGALSLEPGILYTRRGGSYRDQPSGPGGTQAVVELTEFRADYLDFPVLVRFSPVRSAGVRPVFLAGVAWSAVLSSDLESTGIGSGEWAKSADAALLLGLCIRGRGPFGVEVLYRHPVSEVGEAPLAENVEVEGISVLVRIGL